MRADYILFNKRGNESSLGNIVVRSSQMRPLSKMVTGEGKEDQ